jgi:hypothetical protein
MSRSKLSIDPDKPIRDNSVEHSNILSFDPVQPVAIEIMAVCSSAFCGCHVFCCGRNPDAMHAIWQPPAAFSAHFHECERTWQDQQPRFDSLPSMRPT